MMRDAVSNQAFHYSTEVNVSIRKGHELVRHEHNRWSRRNRHLIPLLSIESGKFSWIVRRKKIQSTHLSATTTTTTTNNSLKDEKVIEI